jgi:hypothetical protein
MSIRSRIRRFRERRTTARSAPRASAGPVVPVAKMRDEPPEGDYRLAADYLLDETRLRRRETVLHAYVSEVGTRTTELDFSLPVGEADHDEEDSGTWYVPVSFLRKDQVAPSLEVRDASNGVLAIPTKRENMALTEMAIDRLVESGAISLSHPNETRSQIREIMTSDYLTFRERFSVRVSRLLLQSREPGAEQIFETLSLLEDHFLLWVPIRGLPGSQHHVTVCRAEPHPSLPILGRARKRVILQVQTALGQVKVRVGAPTGRPTVDVGALLSRFLNAFALQPREARAREFEASRFASCHLRFHAPAGFLVRNLRVGVGDGPGDEATPPRIDELDPAERDVVVQGVDTDVGHVHLARTDNPRRVYLNVTLGLRGGNTTLWMLATVLTAGLLWLVHHHGGYGPPELQNKQIVAAALLVGPAFASAWSLRAEGGELLRTSLAGARVLLLGSAVLSVATALALAGVHPIGSGRYDTISAYTAVSFFLAAALVVAWLLSSRPTWQLLRSALATPARNLLTILVLSFLSLLVGLHEGLPLRLAGGLLLLAGLALAVISANTVAERLQSSRTLYRPLAGFGALPLLFAAGYFLGFYTNRFDPDVLRLICVVAGAGLALLVVIGFARLGAGSGEETGV